jgi:quercetin dioxygenase-like cupin family protein
MSQMIAPGEALPLNALVTPTADGIASRILAKTSGGNLTLFAFDAGQGLTEHTSPLKRWSWCCPEGACTLTIGGIPVRATPGRLCGCPRPSPHAVEAFEATRLLLVMLREQKASEDSRWRQTTTPAINPPTIAPPRPEATRRESLLPPRPRIGCSTARIRSAETFSALTALCV